MGRHIPIRKPKEKNEELNEEQEKERREREQKAVEYRKIIAENKSVKKKVPANTGFGRGRGRTNAPPPKPTFQSRMRHQKDTMRLRRLGLESKRQTEERERTRKREIQMRPRTTVTPLTAAGAALQNAATMSQAKANKKILKKAEKLKLQALENAIPASVKISTILTEETKVDEIEDKIAEKKVVKKKK